MTLRREGSRCLSPFPERFDYFPVPVTVPCGGVAGATVVLVEQNARAALKAATRGYVMEVGRVVLEDAAEALLFNPEVRDAYLGGGGGA